MFSFLKKITLLFSLILLTQVVYEFRFKDSAQAWKNNSKPQAASYINLNDDEVILNDLESQTLHSAHKVLDPLFFSKKTIFNPIQ